jgi:hypothetical protein
MIHAMNPMMVSAIPSGGTMMDTTVTMMLMTSHGASRPPMYHPATTVTPAKDSSATSRSQHAQ